MECVLRGLCRFVPVILALMGVSAVANSDVKVDSMSYRGWGNSLRISNGTVEVVVVPAVGRILRYGYIGGPNLIWEDPAFSGEPADPAKFPRFGGNKAWPWPQDEWPRYIGHDWPPPPSTDQAAFTASVSGTDTITLKSPVLAGFGLVIEREIRLAPTGTRVTLITRLRRADVGSGAADPSKALAAWSITPAAAPAALFINLTPDSALPAHHKPLGAFDPFASLTVEGGVLNVVRDPRKSSKVGIDGDAIGAVYGDTLWVLTANRVGRLAAGGEHYTAGERVQIYANADSREDAARGLPPYMELEVTSPRKALTKAGDSVTLTETWELHTIHKGENARAAFQQTLGPE